MIRLAEKGRGLTSYERGSILAERSLCGNAHRAFLRSACAWDTRYPSSFLSLLIPQLLGEHTASACACHNYKRQFSK